MAHRVLDRGVADRQPAFRQRFAGLFRSLRQPRLVVLFGGGRRGVDILQRSVLRQQVRIPGVRGAETF
jgi:hypothetical protein